MDLGDVSTLRTGVVGVGRWGRNVFRNFVQADRCDVRWICDLDQAALQRESISAPNARVTQNYDDLLGDDDLEAVVIATKAITHFDMARRALEAGKHVYVEKPLTLHINEASELRQIAERKKLKLMVGHLMLYHPCVQALKRLIDDGELGEVYYIYTRRLNLGVVRQDENAWWSLAPHDVSVACYLLGDSPIEVSAHGQCYLQSGIEDVVFATLRFGDGKLAHIHVSWLDPHKIRNMTVVGTSRMVSFDDMSAGEKLRIYDKGADLQAGIADFAESIALRTGDILIPKVSHDEPLKLEVEHFISGVLDHREIRTDGRAGEQAVRILEAGSHSLASGGTPIRIDELTTR